MLVLGVFVVVVVAVVLHLKINPICMYKFKSHVFIYTFIYIYINMYVHAYMSSHFYLYINSPLICLVILPPLPPQDIGEVWGDIPEDPFAFDPVPKRYIRWKSIHI
jgi:hypothetical protein